MEMNSRRILYARNVDKPLPMASTTKIATAITVLQSCDDLDKEISIPKEATGIEGSSVYLQPNDRYTIKDLLYGLMLRSGNDCATALALYCNKSVENFADQMNKTAQKAGALHTNFKNPHGLPCEGHYTTARDLSLISCYAMQNDVFKEIVQTKYYAKHKWKNKNKMLYLSEGGVGIKTGYTKKAGRCLVSAVTRENMTLISTLLNCPTTYERSIALLNDAFAAYKNVCLLQSGQIFTIESGKKEIRCCAQEEYVYPLLQEEKGLVEIKTEALDSSADNKKTGEIVGQFQIYLAKQLLFSGNLYKL